MKKFIILSLCIVTLCAVTLTFTICYSSNFVHHKIFIAGDSFSKNAPSPPDENQVFINLSQPILFAGFSSAECVPSPPEEGEAT